MKTRIWRNMWILIHQFSWWIGRVTNFISKVKMRKIKKTLMKRHHQGMIYFRTILLNAVSATFGPITMLFKQQSLSFHVVSETFIAQIYLVFISSNILCFFYLCPFCLELFACFQARDNRGKHNFENIRHWGRNFLWRLLMF